MAAWAAQLKAYGSCGCQGEAGGGCSDHTRKTRGCLLGPWNRLPWHKPSTDGTWMCQLPSQPPSQSTHPCPVPPATPLPAAPRADPGAVVVVVPHEGVEGTQLGPADAQLLGRVSRKAADVGAHQWHPEEVEEQHLCRGGVEGIGAPWGRGHRAHGETPSCRAGKGGKQGHPRSLPGME